MLEETTVNAGADAGATPGTDTGAQATTQQETRAYTEKEFQSEVDRRVAQSMKNYREKELPSLLEQEREAAKTEAEKLAKMTAGQKAEHERQKIEDAFKKREEALLAREQEANRRDLQATVIDTLTEKGLPVSLWKVVNYESAGTCNESIEVLEAEFRKAVEDGVNARLKTATPKSAQSSPTDKNQMVREAMGIKI